MAQNSNDAISFSIVQENGALLLKLSGSWTVFHLNKVELSLKNLINKGRFSSISLEEVKDLDTSGALLINKLIKQFKVDKSNILCTNINYNTLLNTALVPSRESLGHKPPAILVLLNNLGKRATEKFFAASQITGFVGLYLSTFFNILLNPKKMRWTALVSQMDRTGVSAIPIVALLTFLIGMVVAYMGAKELAQLGAQSFSIKLLEVTIMREMGVLITAIIVAGRSSSSFTAQIGSMVANDEIAAMQSMGINPIEVLVVPRVFALTLTLPLLVFIADIVGILGGCLALWYAMDITPIAFFTQYRDVALVNNFLVGLVKSPFFAIMIGVCGCYQGLNAKGSAESVGYLTTISVVQSIFIVIIMDAFFAVFFTTINI